MKKGRTLKFNTDSSSALYTSSGTTSILNRWNPPTRISVDVFEDRIEMIYKEVSTMTLTIFPPRPPEERVFKIIYSCVDGKWNQSAPIYGTIVPATGEYYEFNDQEGGQ